MRRCKRSSLGTQPQGESKHSYHTVGLTGSITTEGFLEGMSALSPRALVTVLG